MGKKKKLRKHLEKRGADHAPTLVICVGKDCCRAFGVTRSRRGHARLRREASPERAPRGRGVPPHLQEGPHRGDVPGDQVQEAGRPGPRASSRRQARPARPLEQARRSASLGLTGTLGSELLHLGATKPLGVAAEVLRCGALGPARVSRALERDDPAGTKRPRRERRAGTCRESPQRPSPRPRCHRSRAAPSPRESRALVPRAEPWTARSARAGGTVLPPMRLTRGLVLGAGSSALGPEGLAFGADSLAGAALRAGAEAGAEASDQTSPAPMAIG